MLKSIRKYKCITPVLLVIFASSAIGLHLDIHWCQGHFSGIKLISLSQGSDSNTCCSDICQTEDDDNGCCSDTELAALMDFDAAPIASTSDHSVKVSLPNIILYNSTRSYSLSDLTPIVLIDTGPPLTGIQRRINFQSFLC